MRRTLRAAAACAALAVAGLAAPAAYADSIAYIKDGDVWLSTSDGARQYQVTFTGAYADVSQADDGTMIALSGVRLHKLDRAGNVLADFDTPVSDTRPAGARVFFGPFDPAISPDGSKVAYTWYYMTQTQDPNCFPPKCLIAINRAGTAYSHSDRQTAWDEIGMHSGWRNPAWADDDTVVLSDPTVLPNRDVVLDTISDGPPGMAHNWFSDLVEGNPHLGAGDITRDKRKLAFLTGQNDSTLSVYHVPSFPTAFKDGEPPAGADPHVCYRYGDAPGGSFGTPTFAPDGRRIAWTDAEGIKVADVPDFSGGCTMNGATLGKTLIAGASQPDWGPADVPPARSKPGAGPGSGGAAIAVKPRAAKLRKALKQGLAVKVAVPGKGRLAATATRAGKKVAAGTRSVAGGTATVKLQFTKKARKSLKRVKRARLTVKVKFTPATGAAQVVTTAVTLKR
jgi:WD40 repeat protein